MPCSMSVTASTPLEADRAEEVDSNLVRVQDVATGAMVIDRKVLLQVVLPTVVASAAGKAVKAASPMGHKDEPHEVVVDPVVLRAASAAASVVAVASVVDANKKDIV